MISRPRALAKIQTALSRSRVVALIGPRQCGKTTLAREIVPAASINYFDLEEPVSLARLDAPMAALSPLTGVVVIDEIQRMPALFPILRALAYRGTMAARSLILGSASPSLIRGSSESLAGRLETVTLGGFTLPEVGASNLSRHWLHGGSHRHFLRPERRIAASGVAASSRLSWSETFSYSSLTLQHRPSTDCERW